LLKIAITRPVKKTSAPPGQLSSVFDKLAGDGLVIPGITGGVVDGFAGQANDEFAGQANDEFAGQATGK
jgi:hypothetical protein